MDGAFQKAADTENKKAINIKDVTDDLEKGHGCKLLFDETFQSLNKDFEGQMGIIKKIEEEARQRSSEALNFNYISSSLTGKNNKVLDLKGVSIEIVGDDKKTKTPIFQEIMSIDHETGKPVAVQKGCKP